MGIGYGRLSMLKVTTVTIRQTQGVGRFNAIHNGSVGAGDTEFTALEGSETGGTTEVNFRGPIGRSIRITRIKAKAQTNTADGAINVGIRDDGATVASVSIPAGSTTLQDSGPLAVVIAADSLCNMVYADAGAITVGSVSFISVEVEYDGQV